MSKTWGEIREAALAEVQRKNAKTNGDRIRAMTDEEMAMKIAKIADCGECKVERNRCNVSDGTCALAWLDWLTQESKE